jgi:hypothetical protein
MRRSDVSRVWMLPAPGTPWSLKKVSLVSASASGGAGCQPTRAVRLAWSKALLCRRSSTAAPGLAVSPWSFRNSKLPALPR